MPEWTISFRYDEERGLAWHQVLFESLSTKRGLKLAGSGVEERAPCKPEHLAQAPQGIWDDQELDRLRAEGALELSPEKIEALCRAITIHTQVFANDDESIKITVEAAERNEFPCLGYWTWVEDDLRLPGGFVKIEAAGQTVIDAIGKEILAATSR